MTNNSLDWINAVLQNDENSSDAEMVAYFVSEGLTDPSANWYVGQRQAAAKDMHYQAVCYTQNFGQRPHSSESLLRSYGIFHRSAKR